MKYAVMQCKLKHRFLHPKAVVNDDVVLPGVQADLKALALAKPWKYYD